MIISASASETLDAAGDAVETEVAIQTVGEIQPRSPSEPGGHPDISDSDWIGFFLPADEPYLDSASTVWVPGLGEFEVVGKSPTWRDPFDQIDSYVEVNLNRTAGAGDSEGS